MHPFLGPPTGSIPLQHRFPPTGSRLMGTAPLPHGNGYGPMVQQTTSPTMSHTRRRMLPHLFDSAALGEGLTLTTVLAYVQRIIGVTQQVTPMIKQYGPYVKRIPALWRMLRGTHAPSQQHNTYGNTMSPENHARQHTQHAYGQHNPSQPKLYV